MKKIPLVIAVLIGGTLAYFLASRPQSGTATTESLEPAAALSAPGLDGKTISLKDYAGKVVLVDFWATWCDPCRAEMPELVKIQEDFRDKGVVVLGVSMDEETSRVAPFIKKAGVNYPILLLGAERAPAGWVVPGLPTAYIVGKDGTLLKRFFGAKSAATLTRELEAALAR